MSSKRLKKISGRLEQDSFKALLQQIEGKAILVVLMINQNCHDCMKLIEFINQLEAGWIQKMPQLVLLYGFNNTPIAGAEDDRREPPQELATNAEGEVIEEEGEVTTTSGAKLGSSNHLEWEGLPEGHGYAIFQSADDISYFQGFFEHDEFKQNILDSIRRFKTSIKTLAGLAEKRVFLEKRGSGIIVETSSLTQPSQISELEQKINSYSDKLKVSVYFCKGLAQEISYVRNGQVLAKVKGFDFDKIVKKISKISKD